MRATASFLALLVFFGVAIEAQGQAARPQFRPAVLGFGSNSLVNRIDTQALLQAGQKNGAVMFCALLNTAGEPITSWTYRGMPDTTALEEELTRRLQETKFTPAIYNHQPAGVLLYGTVFFLPDSKPSLRVFLNQDPQELKDASDFVGPQPVIGGDSQFKGLHLPAGELPVRLTGIVDLGLKVDKSGNLQELQVLAEEPPLLGFGAAAGVDFRGAKFIPAFRNGDPTDSNTVLPVCYKPVE
ncbi:MAG: hypothetical protein H0W04_05975 [Chthoniobacterales bacterium]|nr:hypothetical protein [Chthoniobacterales bacterium]